MFGCRLIAGFWRARQRYLRKCRGFVQLEIVVAGWGLQNGKRPGLLLFFDYWGKLYWCFANQIHGNRGLNRVN
jgi:hypothetical protein